MIRSLLVWVFTWIYMAVAGLICLPWVWLTGRLGLVYAAGRLGVRLLLALAGVRVRVEGRELLSACGRTASEAEGGADQREAGGEAPEARRHAAVGCIYMANHQSNLDPPVLLAYLPGYLSFLAKRELFRVPVLGTVARAGGIVPVDRSNRAAAHASIARAAEAVRRGRPFLIFPEGTRSPDGRLLEFKKGAFFFAVQAQAPVVPVTISGTGALMPRGQWRIRPGVVHLRVHPPVLPSEWSADPDPRSALAALVRARLLATPAATPAPVPPADAGADEARSVPHPDPR